MSTNGTILQYKFNHEYNKFGLQVQNIIDSIDGFVQVITPAAAPITAMLTLRIAKILSTTGTRAENIYWLTSADSSVIAIKNKLSELIGAQAGSINILTFQTFCEKIILQHRELFENNSMQPVSTLESIQLLKKLIVRFPKDHPLKRYRSDVYHEISHLQMLFSFMKREGLTSQYLIQEVNEFKTNDQSDTNLEFISHSNKTILKEKMRAGIKEFDHYQNLLQENYRYDNDDIINLVLKAFEENNNLRSEYREKIEYIQLDDEAALSLPARKLLQLLVGTNKLSNFLTVEYDQPVIPPPEQITWDEATGQTNHWKTIKIDYNQIKEKEPGHKPTINNYNSVREEMAGIVNHVHELLQQRTVANEIAIVYQEDKFGSAMEQHLIVKKIPFYTRQNMNVLEQPFIKKIIQLLRYISIESDAPCSGDDLLFEILHFDFYEIPPIEIAKLSVEVYNKKYSKSPTGIRKLLRERANAPAKDLFDTGLNKNLKDVSNILEKTIGEASNSSVVEIFENIIHQAEVISYIDQSSDRNWLMQLLAALGHFIKTETDRNPRLKLNELITVIDTMEQGFLPLPIIHIKGNENCVQLINASEALHRQFKFVFIAGANTGKPLKDDWLKCIFKLPGITPLLRSANFDKCGQRALYQLFYTMLFGNAAHLFVSFAKYDHKGNPLAPAELIVEYISVHSIQINHKVLTADELSDYLVLDKAKLLPEIAHPEEAFIAPMLKKFVMNVSALNSYLNCPLGFYYKNILHVPYGKSEAMEFGSAIHYALENLFRKMSSGLAEGAHGRPERQPPFPSATTMVEDFTLFMQSRRAYFTNETYERRLQYGSDVLQNYYHQYINSWNKVVSVERNIRSKTGSGVPIKGKTDKLEFYGNEVVIVDYKSGDIEKALLKMNPPNDHNPAGGDYWRQAVFYTILVDNYEQKDWKVIGTEFDFVEPREKNDYRKIRIEITPADTATVTHQITEAWNKIQAHNFYTGCGRQDCHWCNFVKINNLAVTLHETEIAGTTN